MKGVRKYLFFFSFFQSQKNHSANGLFRPTPDREINDDEVELDFRRGDLTFQKKDGANMTPKEKRDKEHYDWMTKLAKSSYLEKDPLHDNPPLSLDKTWLHQRLG
jgi:hypothetical protein